MICLTVQHDLQGAGRHLRITKRRHFFIIILTTNPRRPWLWDVNRRHGDLVSLPPLPHRGECKH